MSAIKDTVEMDHWSDWNNKLKAVYAYKILMNLWIITEWDDQKSTCTTTKREMNREPTRFSHGD